MLTTTKIKNLKPKEKKYRVYDSGNLYLEIAPTGTKSWRFKYRFQRKEKVLTFGKFPYITLADARQKREEAKKLLAHGIDPGAKKREQKAKARNTFQKVAMDWWKARKDKWSPDHAQLVWRRLEANILPWLGDKPISEVTSKELLEALRRVENRGAIETARRICQVLNQVFVFAIASGYCENNPANSLTLALKERKKRHFPAITEPKKIRQLLLDIEAFEGTFIVRQALRLLPLVFVRPGELRHAEWNEIDLEQALWAIPASKMKKKRDHLVPLSRQAIKILRELQPLTGDGPYIFPSVRSRHRPISENTLNVALRRLGYTKDQLVAHGFRTMASTMLHELGWPSHVIEAQLAHVDPNKVRGVYNRAEYLPERKRMMQSWADYLDALKSGGHIIPLKKSQHCS